MVALAWYMCLSVCVSVRVCTRVVTQLLVDDLLVYNGTVNMASGMSAVGCHTIVFTDSTQQELSTTTVVYAALHYVTLSYQVTIFPFTFINCC